MTAADRLTEGIVLRPMRWPDLAAVLRIEVEVFESTAWSAETFWAELAGVPDSRAYWVALDGNRVVGYAGLRAVPPDGDVQTIARSVDARGRGLGEALLTQVIEEASRRGCHQLLLEVAADNAAARRLYERHGFDQLARRAGYYGSGRDALIMRRRLTADRTSDSGSGERR